MVTVTNPILEQVLHRRRMLRLARWSVAAWVVFGTAHIIAWSAAFDHRFSLFSGDLPTHLVWPLLLAATISFVSMIVFGARYFLTPEER